MFVGPNVQEGVTIKVSTPIAVVFAAIVMMQELNIDFWEAVNAVLRNIGYF